MSNLFDATYKLAGFLMPMRRGAATGGSVTALIDTLATFSSDQVDGTLFMFSGDLANKSLRVTSLTGTTQVNFATQTPNDVAAGNLYALSNSDFPRETLRWAINEALREYAKRRAEDATLLTVAEQEEYTLPAGVSDVKEVWQARNTAAPYDWFELHHWDEIDGELVFPTGFVPSLDDYKLKLVYREAHVDLTTDAAELPTDVNENLIHWQAAVIAARDGNARFHDDPKRDMTNKMNEAQEKLAEARRNWKPWQRSARAADY